jgi:threonine dehydrogenase-like Zn-dependent dehydrogenase
MNMAMAMFACTLAESVSAEQTCRHISRRTPWQGTPRIPGHEIGAIVESCGPSVPDKIRSGIAVTVLPYTSCGSCSACPRGRPNTCCRNETLGVQRDGALAEILVVPWQKVITSKKLSPDDLVFVDPLSVGFHAVERGRVTDSHTVLVIGCGMIGLGAVARATASTISSALNPPISAPPPRTLSGRVVGPALIMLTRTTLVWLR